MLMRIQSVTDPAFAPYGRLISGLEAAPLLEALRTTDKPEAGVAYVPSCPALEETDAFPALRDGVYGGMPIQIGYCNGTNTRLNCLEYHRDSEINIPADDMVFLVARQQELEGGRIPAARVEAFRAPAGAVVELYATTLHYAPCDAAKGAGFRVAVVLPRGTNTQRPEGGPYTPEDKLLWARNKWLVAHADTDEARQGAFVGILGENPDIADSI